MSETTAEQKVKAKWPDALCVRSEDGFCRVWNGLEDYGDFKMLSKAVSESEAWSCALARLSWEEKK